MSRVRAETSWLKISLFRVFAEKKTANEIINNSPSRASSEFFLFADGEILTWYRLKLSLFFSQFINTGRTAYGLSI